MESVDARPTDSRKQREGGASRDILAPPPPPVKKKRVRGLAPRAAHKKRAGTHQGTGPFSLPLHIATPPGCSRVCGLDPRHGHTVRVSTPSHSILLSYSLGLTF